MLLPRDCGRKEAVVNADFWEYLVIGISLGCGVGMLAFLVAFYPWRQS